MPTTLPIEQFLATGLPVIDVRSPGEFARGHIPGACNIPLFSDAERALVGTLYKQQGRDAAMLEGLRIVGPKMATMVEETRAKATQTSVAVHCWRGGERSASVAWLLEKAGFAQVVTLTHGYKAFRKHVLDSFERPWNLQVLGGFTGTGKTELLHLLQKAGEAVIDLEQLARHKGSSFGGLGEAAQPSTEMFENTLWNDLNRFDQHRPIWVEDESQMIGRVKIPDPFFARMRAANLYFVDMAKDERTTRLVNDYGAYPKQALAEATLRIQSRLGPQRAKEALAALDCGDLIQVASITLAYYDKTYARGLAARNPLQVLRLPTHGDSPSTIAQRLIDERNTPQRHPPHRI